MKINRDNYEAYFLDYHEGQLSPEMAEEVLMFVKLNPDLRSVLEEFETVSLIADQNITFDKKSMLKKNQVFGTSQVNELNYDEFLVSETEGLLNAEQLQAINEFVALNPQFEKDRKLYALSHLSPDDKVVFKAKESLKKKAIPVGVIDAETYETYLARELEGDLSENEILLLAEFMQFNPQFEKDRKLYSHTILTADENIVFEGKNNLKHSVVIPIRRIIYYALSAAASLALIFSIYFLLDRNDIPRSIAEKGKARNTVSKIISEPITAQNEKQIASPNTSNSKAASVQGNIQRSSSNTPEPEVIEIPGQADGQMAFVDRNPVESLEARSARKITTRSYVDPEFKFIRISQMYSNQNLEYYYNLRLAQEIEYAQLNSKDQKPTKTIFNSISGKAQDLFAQNSKSPEKEEKKNVSLWTFAQLGVQTFNTITSSDLELNLKKDDEGKVVGYDLEGNLINIEKDLTK